MHSGNILGIGYAETVYQTPLRNINVNVTVSIDGFEDYNFTVLYTIASTSCNGERNYTVTVAASNYFSTRTVTYNVSIADGGDLNVLWNQSLESDQNDNQLPTRVNVCVQDESWYECKTSYIERSIVGLDVNECDSKPSLCDECQNCTNTAGSYFCVNTTGCDTNMHESPNPDPDQYEYLALLSIAPLLALIAMIILRRRDQKKFQTQLTTQGMKWRQNSQYYMPCDLEEYVEDPAWELVPDSLTMVKEVGEGAFGKVYEGVLATIEDGDLTVAIKTLSTCENVAQRNAFLGEASIMKKFDCPYVMRLFGLVSTVNKPLVVMEFMAEGDLRGYLMKCRPQEEQFATRFSGSSQSTSKAPSVDQFKLWALQLAKGMAHVHEKHFVHRDLAARNCMIATNLVLKIGDFGFTRDIYESDYYRKTGGGVLPVRWMGPECLRDGLYIPESDVWSYGIVLWEMATLRGPAIPGESHEEVMNMVIGSGHMERPTVLHDFPSQCMDIMERCWQFQPADRPTFADIVRVLDDSPYQEPLWEQTSENQSSGEPPGDNNVFPVMVGDSSVSEQLLDIIISNHKSQEFPEDHTSLKLRGRTENQGHNVSTWLWTNANDSYYPLPSHV
uniref:Tyrosine-protein kinase receptor n=1 Tax=Sycon raphanus TaxID=56443 RepID=Q9GRH1_9METZ|nr:tyrosine kinase [Sycon raphanus]